MKILNDVTKYVGVGVLAMSISSSIFAADGAVEDAWLDGKLDTVVLFNEHLNPFDIDTDVKNGVAIINGEVDSNIKKDLASELALSIDGISKVVNNVNVVKPKDKEDQVTEDKVSDAIITASISTKLLLNTEINSTKIDVDTENKSVTLSGSVDSKIEKDLVEKIAENTSNVEEVNNLLTLR